MDRRLQILADRSLACRPDKLPMLADLGESGALEQDSDIVAFIYRDDTYNTDSPHSPDKGTAEIIVANTATARRPRSAWRSSST